MHHSLILALALGAGPQSTGDTGPFVRALWLLQRFGTAEAADPANDARLKGVLFKALGKDGELQLSNLDGLMDSETFKKLAGADGRINPAEVERALESDVPRSRLRLLPRVRAHADFLTTSFDMIDEQHRLAGQKLAEWIAANYRPGKQLDVIAVCTANSRRSFLGETMGNIAAAYYGMPEIRFHSGGTAATRIQQSHSTWRSRRSAWKSSQPARKSPRGEPGTANPIYRLCWGAAESGEVSLQTTEFSKRYDDSTNPRQGFAALMVCGEADAACPSVKGSVLRVSMPYLDPKIYDGGAFEEAKYAERRDDMARRDALGDAPGPETG